MAKFPWKTVTAGAAVLAVTAYAFAQSGPGMGGPMGMHGPMHQQMMQGGHQAGMNMHEQMMKGGVNGGKHGGMSGHGGMHGRESGALPTSPGQDAFGAIQEVVQILEADPKTDWSKVNIGALREHLIDMNEVTLNAKASERMLDNGIEVTMTGDGRTRDAIKRMVPAHVRELSAHGWDAKTEDLPNGVKMTVMTSATQPLAKLKALGFIGIMAQGAHHQPHHLMMAKGEFAH